jgi:hypothetical protein
MKKNVFAVFALAVLLSASVAWAGDPDLQGRVTRIDYPKNSLVVQNELENNIGKREYRVKIKQGMINDYKKNDKLKIWLMADRKEAAHVEMVSR